MTRFKNYKNSYSNDSRIFSMEDLLKMSMNEFFDRENEIDTQDNLIGLPTNNELKHSQNVRFVGSHIDKNGQTVPSRWEAYNPFKQMRLPRTPEEWEEFNKNITHNIKTHDFPELDEILRKAIEKLRNSRQSVKPLSTDINETDQNFSDYFTDDENDGYDDEMETNDNLDNSLSKMINPISSLLSAGSLNNLFNTDEKIDDKLYDIEPQKTYKSVYSQNPIVENKRQEEQQDDNLKKYINELLNNNTTQEKEKSLKEHIEELNSQQIYPDGVIHAPLHGDTPTLTGQVKMNDIEREIFDKPTKPLKDLINKIKNNGTDYNTPKTTWEKIQEKIYTDYFKNILPMSSNATKNGLTNLESAQNDKNATIYNSLDNLQDEKLKETLKQYGAKENMRGIHYDDASLNAHKISNSKEVKKFINDMCENGGVLNNNLINFKFDITQPIDSIDRYASIQHAKIYNPHVSEDGNYIEGKIIDISDFEKRDTQNLLNIPNNWGKNMQDKGQYENYYIIIDLKIPLTEEQKELLRKNRLKY